MPCIDPSTRAVARAAAARPAVTGTADPAWRRRSRATLAAAAMALAGCAGAPTPPAAGLPAARPPPPAAAVSPTPVVARTWTEYRMHTAQRIVAANPERVYAGPVPDPLLAIPVLEIELEGDGRLRHIKVLRVPTQARDTTQMAIDAVRRAAPFAPVAHLPRPWKFVEVFLFDDTRRFKPRTLDID